MWYDNLYGVFHLKGIRTNVGYLGANFEINKARTCGIAYCDIFHQKAYIITFNECFNFQQRRGNNPCGTC